MSARRAITLRLGLDDYDHVDAEAKRLGVTPAALVRMYVQDHLSRDETEQKTRRRIGLDALDRLAKLTADLPTADAVKIAQASREELETRPNL